MKKGKPKNSITQKAKEVLFYAMLKMRSFDVSNPHGT